MPAPVAIVKVRLIKSVSDVLRAARHNLRDEHDPHENIDATRTWMNVVLAGSESAKDVMTLYHQLLDAAQPTSLRKDGTRAKMRHDAVLTVELVISVPPGAVADVAAFFTDTMTWIDERFGVPVLSAVWHRDQSNEHVHCLLMPLKNGRMVGSSLVGVYSRMHDDFHRQVGQKHGMARTRHLNEQSRRNAANMLMSALDANPALLQTPAFRAALQAAFERDPTPLLESAGLIQERPLEKEWVKTMTRPITASASKPIGFDRAHRTAAHADQPVDDRSPSCNRVRCEQPPVEGHAGLAADGHDADSQPSAEPPERLIRIRDTDLSPDTWDSDLGEHVPVGPLPVRSRPGAAAIRSRSWFVPALVMLPPASRHSLV